MIYSMHGSTEDPLYHPTVIKQDQQSWKGILIVDDNEDVTTTFKAGLEYSNTNRKIKVYTCNNPLIALSEFKPNFYDLLLVDIKMPQMNGFEPASLSSSAASLLVLSAAIAQYILILVVPLSYKCSGLLSRCFCFICMSISTSIRIMTRELVKVYSLYQVY
ncbi:MAG: response regulator [Candidatus Nitrosopolaris sp.]